MVREVCMSLYTKIDMKELLAEGLYILVLEKSFSKITIKQICDKTGVIRGTFYNHFIDKYEALEYLTYKILIKDFIENEQEVVTYEEILKNIIYTIEEKRDFFNRAFLIDGQNNFEGMLRNIFTNLFLHYFEEKNIEFSEKFISQEFMSAYQANSLLFIIRDWINHGFILTCEEVLMQCKILFLKI